MKNIFRLLGFITLIVIGFTFTACPEPGLPGTISISGHAQVGQTLTAETNNLGGSGTISYEWWRDGTTVIGNGSTYTIQNEDIGSTITLTVTRSDNSGSVTSEPTTVIIAVPVITINTQPAATANVTAGNISGNLTVSANVTAGATLSYQWYSNTANSNIGGTVISGATSSSYAILTTLTAGTYYYFCEVRATNGATSVRSNVSTVNVAVPVIIINTQPTQTTNLSAGNISGNLSVTASVTGNAELSYQWHSNATNNNSGGTIISGATSSSYIVPTTLSVGTYYYYCQVTATGAAPVRSNVARVNIIPPTFPVEMVYVSGGSFELGRNLGTGGGWDETPISTVNISGFYMGKYQVTQEQYQAVMGTNPSNFNGGSGREPVSGEVQERRPVETVSWYDALVFCNRLSIMEELTPAYSISGSTNPNDWGTVPTSSNETWDAVQIVSGSTGYRLPTEAQWEYAAKGGNGSPGNFTYSGSNDPDAVAWYWDNWDNTGSRTHEVGKKAPNGLGIYDMSGNVSEWCWDWLRYYTSTTKTDPISMEPSGSLRVVRGGSWSLPAENVRSVSRNSNGFPNGRDSTLGFRVSRP